MPTNRLKRIRLARGWTQADLATAAGVAEATVVDLERGQARPQVATQVRVAATFGLAVTDIWPPHNRGQRRPPAVLPDIDPEVEPELARLIAETANLLARAWRQQTRAQRQAVGS